MPLPLPEPVANPYGECTTNTTLTAGENEMLIRVCFPTDVNSISPLGDPETAPYNVLTVLTNQISSWIPGILQTNNFDVQCQVFKTSQVNGLYLINNHPDVFSEYVAH